MQNFRTGLDWSEAQAIELLDASAGGLISMSVIEALSVLMLNDNLPERFERLATMYKQEGVLEEGGLINWDNFWNKKKATSTDIFDEQDVRHFFSLMPLLSSFSPNAKPVIVKAVVNNMFVTGYGYSVENQIEMVYILVDQEVISNLEDRSLTPKEAKDLSDRVYEKDIKV